MRNETLQIVLTNLFHQRTRSFITLVGIIIGITTIVGLVSVGQGLRDNISAEFEKVGMDNVMIRPKGLGFLGAYTSSFTENEKKLVDSVRVCFASSGRSSLSKQATIFLSIDLFKSSFGLKYFVRI